MNSNQIAEFLGMDWQRALGRSLNIPIEAVPQEREPSPGLAGEGWTWLGNGDDPSALYVGASDSAWKTLAEWIVPGQSDSDGGKIPAECRAALAGAWKDLASRLGLTVGTSQVILPADFDSGTMQTRVCSLEIPGATSILLAAAFGDGLLRDARRVYDFGGIAPELAGLRFSLHVIVGRRGMQLKDVLQLAAGSTIELGKRAADPIEVRVNDRILGEGHAAVCGDRYGISLNVPLAKAEGERES
jgi:hypothetical protein